MGQLGDGSLFKCELDPFTTTTLGLGDASPYGDASPNLGDASPNLGDASPNLGDA